MKKAGEVAVPATIGEQLAGVLRQTRLQMALAAMLLVFVWGAWTWVQFGRSVGGPIGLFTQTDFPAITIVSRMVSEGRGAEIYNLDAQLEGQQRLIAEGYLRLGKGETLKYPYPYAPFIAVLASPLSGIEPNMAWAVWDLLNLACMTWGLWYLLSTLALPANSRLLLFIGGLTSFPLIVNLEQGQSSGLVMLALGVGIGLLKRGRDLPAGLALGLLAVKVQWLPFLVLVLLWKRRWRTLGGMIATSCALAGMTVLAAGFGWIPGYLDMLVRAQGYARELLLDPWYSHSLAGGLTALLGRGTDDIVRIANLVVMVGMAALLLWVWRGRWEPRASRWDGLMALTVLASMLTNPQLNTHDLCLLVLPGALGLAYLAQSTQLQKHRTIFAWCGILWGAYIATSLFLPQVFSLSLRASTLAIVLMCWLLAHNLARKVPEMPSQAIPSAISL